MPWFRIRSRRSQASPNTSARVYGLLAVRRLSALNAATGCVPGICRGIVFQADSHRGADRVF